MWMRIVVVALALSVAVGCRSTVPIRHGPKAILESKPTFRILSQKQLDAAIVPVSDLPTGFGVDPSAEKPTGVTKYYCDYKPPYKEKSMAEGDFIKGGGLGAEVISASLRQYDSALHAKKAFDAMVTTMKTCSKDTMGDSSITYSVLSMPKIEDGSFAVSVTPDDGGVGYPKFYALVGPTLVAAGGGGLMTADADSYVDVLKKQVARYKAAAER